MRRAVSAVVAMLLALTACSDGPTPGKVAANGAR
ncbi:hypothetical protein SCHAM137S_06060 [Streptomyces chartreusis]